MLAKNKTNSLICLFELLQKESENTFSKNKGVCLILRQFHLHHLRKDVKGIAPQHVERVYQSGQTPTSATRQGDRQVSLLIGHAEPSPQPVD